MILHSTVYNVIHLLIKTTKLPFDSFIMNGNILKYEKILKYVLKNNKKKRKNKRRNIVLFMNYSKS